MDFWSRLIGGSGRDGKQTSPKKDSPQQRLARFRKAHSSVQSICSQPQRLSQPGSQIEQLLLSLRQLAGLLREELRSPAPYPCLALASTSQIYNAIARAASACKDQRLIREAVSIFSILIDSEMEGFVTSRAFARALMRFSMRVLDAYYVFVNAETESLLVEVLFNIAAKIRLEPDVLSVWFAPSDRAEDEVSFIREKKSFAGITKKDDFPLCYLFIDRVHSEGRIGDFARTGLLYIFEAAPRAPALESWIVASDLPTLMASALGALYSQLSRELSLLQDHNNLPMLLAMSDYVEQNQDTGVESITSQSHKAHMATFLSDLTFWQDILDHCRSDDVRQTLLDHFHILFLQQLLYPSLLQSSDTDGGSSVAVMTYLNSILQTLTDEGLSNMLLTYLLGSKPADPEQPESPSVLMRRSSLITLSKPESGEEPLEPDLFNLVDLIHNGIQSHAPQTVFASLKLFTTILTLQPSHALGRLVRLRPEYRSLPDRTIGALHLETATLMNLAAAIGGPDGMDEAFAGASYDFKKNVELIALRRAQAGHEIDSRNNSIVLPTEATSKIPQTPLDFNDTGVKSILTLLRTFLCNAVDTNLALSEALLTLATSMDVDISGLLAIRPDRYTFSPQSKLPSNSQPSWMSDEETDALEAAWDARQVPHFDAKNKPSVQTALEAVQGSVVSLRQSLARFDAILSKRKAILQTPQQAELFSTPVKAAQTKKPSLSLSRHASPSPMPRPGLKGHARQTSITALNSRTESPSRSALGTPRGRRGSGMPASPTSPTMTSPMLLPQRTSSRQPRPQSTLGSPMRSLTANIFRPPPPESDVALSPPRMGSITAAALNNAPRSNTSRNGSIAASLGRSPSPNKMHANLALGGDNAEPAAQGENDAETLNLRIRFDRNGAILGIGPNTPGGRTLDNSALASGVQSPAPHGRQATGPLDLAGRLRSRGEVVPPSTRESSVGGDARDGGNGRGGAGAAAGAGANTVDDSDGDDPDGAMAASAVDEHVTEVSLSHVLTNIVVLQNFILELVAVMQHRALVYEGEVGFH